VVMNIDGVTDGIRSGSEVSVAINVFELLRAGCRIFRSTNDVLLTEGIGDAGISPAFIVGIERISDSTAVYPHPTVALDTTCRPIMTDGAPVSLHHSCVASNETAAAILAAVPSAMDIEEDEIPEPQRKNLTRRFFRMSQSPIAAKLRATARSLLPDRAKTRQSTQYLLSSP
jgi:hypothetical protein